jgi:hypothetical protein
VAGDTLIVVRIGCETTVNAIVVEAVSDPLVPVKVTVDAVAVAVGATVNVILLVVEPEIDTGTNAAVTPVGRPVAVRATVPVNPFVPASAIVLVPAAPWFTLSELGNTDSVKLGAGVTVTDDVPATGLKLAVTVNVPAAVATYKPEVEIVPPPEVVQVKVGCVARALPN